MRKLSHKNDIAIFKRHEVLVLLSQMEKYIERMICLPKNMLFPRELLYKSLHWTQNWLFSLNIPKKSGVWKKNEL